MKEKIFPIIITLSALSVSASAAFYSVFGLSKLFAGASTEVIIMAGALEAAKLVVASLLYQYWDTINKFLRAYFVIACFVLIIITSGGIYGFLSGAYQETSTQSEFLDKQVAVIEQKQVRFEEQKGDLKIEKAALAKSISDLRVSLSNPQQVSWYDKNSETVITSTSSSARKALQSELKTTIADRDNINIKIEAVMDSINKTDMVLLDKEISNEAESELGPLKYLAETTGYPMNQVVNWFLLLIIFVFDPLAIALVVASNMAFAKINKPEKEDYFVSRNKHIEKITLDPNPTVPVEEQTLEEQKKDHFNDLQDYAKVIREEPMDSSTYPKTLMGVSTHLEEATNKRMDIIGQNGNDGLHYEKELYLESKNDVDLTKIGNYLNTIDYVDKKKVPGYDLKNGDELVEELSRLTDTTKTLIVKGEESEKKERVLRYDKTDRK